MIESLIKQIMETAFGKWTPQYGCSANEIKDKETHLGLIFPEPLKDYYAIAGKHSEMMYKDYHVAPLKNLTIRDDCLVFCEEKQSKAEWGIELRNLDLPNPQVSGRDQRTKKDYPEKWFFESMKASAYLINLGCWQAIMSQKEIMRCHLPETRQYSNKKILEPYLKPIGELMLRTGADKISFTNTSNKILATYSKLSGYLYLGASQKSDITELQDRIGFKFKRYDPMQVEEHKWPNKHISKTVFQDSGSITDFLRLIFEVGFEEWKEQYGCSREEIKSTENRLGILLPEPLKEYYAIAGKHSELMDKDYHVTPLEKLAIKDNCLVFCEENQGLAEWGVKVNSLDKLDLKIVGRWEGVKNWSTYAICARAYFANLACWQAIMSQPEVARCEMSKKELKKIETYFEPLGVFELQRGNGSISFIDRSNGILATYSHITEELYVGTPREDGLEAFEERTGLDLEWL
jgi:hypothetical protein